MFSMAVGVPRSYPDLMNESETPNATAWLARMRARAGVAAALAMLNLSAAS